MGNKIIVVGSSNTDMVAKLPRIPSTGETVMGTDFFIFHGGKGANQAVAAARAGGSVTFIACVGDDNFANESIENYKKDQIDTSCIKIQPKMHSGMALIFLSEAGENSIAVTPRANNYLKADDIHKNRNVFADASVVLLQLEMPMETVEAAIEVAASKGVPVILNPAPAAMIKDDLYKRITVLTPNETEAAFLTLRKEFTAEDFPAMAKDLFDKGVENVIITLGDKGVYLKNNEFDGTISGYKVKPVDPTAAGDVFNGTLSVALAQGKDLQEAIDFAQKAAAISVTRLGAQPSAPNLNEILNYEI